MAVLGPITLLNNVFPNGVDPALLSTLSLEEGLSQDTAVAQAASIIGARNELLMQRYGGLLATTSRRDLEYRAGTGTRDMTGKSAELSRNFVHRGAEAGHMLPRDDFDSGVDYDYNFAKRGNGRKFLLSLEQLADEWENRVDYDIVLRALTSTEISVGAGYSVGWAIGTGGSVPFVPPQVNGHLFDTSHTHFIFLDTTVPNTFANLFTTMMKELRHHGISGMISIFVSETDVPTIAAVPGFVDIEAPRVLISNVSGAPVRYIEDQALSDLQGVPGQVVGYFRATGYGIAEIRSLPRVPQHYAFAVKSYGLGNANNALAMYVEGPGFGLVIEPNYTVTPELKLNRVRVMATHGIGVNTGRISGVAGYLASGASSYVDPTALIAS